MKKISANCIQFRVHQDKVNTIPGSRKYDGSELCKKNRLNKHVVKDLGAVKNN